MNQELQNSDIPNTMVRAPFYREWRKQIRWKEFIGLKLEVLWVSHSVGGFLQPAILLL